MTLTPSAFITPIGLPKTKAKSEKTSLKTPRRSPETKVTQNTLASPPPPTRPPPPPFRPPPSSNPSPSRPIKGRKALQTTLQSYPPNTPIIVFFHARWCRVCKTLAAKLAAVATLFPQLVWLDVDFADLENKPLVHTLGVKLLPTFRLYRGGADDQEDALEEFTTGPFGSQRLIDRLNEFFEAHRDLA